MHPESAEEYHERIVDHLGPEGRLPVAVQEMPGWDIYPYEVESLRLKPLQPLADAEPPRRGEDPAECWCAGTPGAVAARFDGYVWRNERWMLTANLEQSLPVLLTLVPVAAHCDLPTVPDDLASEMGRLIVAVSAAVEALPSVGRVQLAKWGDGGAHLHLIFLGRPARAIQFRGSPLLDWAENLPDVPADVLRVNARFVAEHLAAGVGGEIGSTAASR
jgi:diadenosine tetraphosphate (Ap4A) HIT family hydrolase